MRRLDRYILRRYLFCLGLSVLALLLLSVIVDLIERLDVFIDHRTSHTQILRYYFYRLPYWLVLTLPVAALLGTLFALTGLAYRNEIMAMKAAGISLYRILLPIYAFALAFSGAVFLFTDLVVPESTRRFNIVRDQVRALNRDDGSRRRVLLQDRGGQLIFARAYTSGRQRATDVLWERLDGARVVERVQAEALQWRASDGWVFVGGRHYGFDAEGGQAVPFDSLEAPITLVPSDFARQEKHPEEMDYSELKRYIARATANGEDATRHRVDLHLKLSFPFTCFVIVLLGAPIAAGARHAGLASTFGRGLLICFVFYGCVQAGQALGWNKVLSPLVGAWLANIVFGAVAFYLLRKAHK